MKGLILIIVGGSFGGCMRWLLSENIKLVEQCVVSILTAFIVPSLFYIVNKSLLIPVFLQSTISKNDFIFFSLCVLIGLLTSVSKSIKK